MHKEVKFKGFLIAVVIPLIQNAVLMSSSLCVSGDCELLCDRNQAYSASALLRTQHTQRSRACVHRLCSRTCHSTAGCKEPLGPGGITYLNSLVLAASSNNHQLRNFYALPLQMCHGAGTEDEPLGPGDVNRPNGLGPAAAAAAASNTGASNGNRNGAPPKGKATPKDLGCRLMLDCMGHYSDVVKQVCRGWWWRFLSAPTHSPSLKQLWAVPPD